MHFASEKKIYDNESLYSESLSTKNGVTSNKWMNLFTTISSRFVGQDDWNGVVGWGDVWGSSDRKHQKSRIIIRRTLDHWQNSYEMCVISNNQGTGFKNYSQNVRLIDF